eukprot:TRINITY_DN2177_c0_g1_i3.p2 TRINITY_DN2177_c0_g1~~TRINITY_DN2177_c0_g1_i3.p2  ORF type:complete len:305 (+),score=109.61 TRINITY_DN2177_c0_g1_i3:69-983(+)
MLRAVLLLATACVGVSGHGLVKWPPSRSMWCSPKLAPEHTPDGKVQNSDCGSAKYCPHCVENEDGLWPVDRYTNTIASGELSKFAPLNEQSPTRWHKSAMRPGRNVFTWFYTAPHGTRDWSYFITKVGWDQSKPLGTDTLEKKPFCYVHARYETPPAEQGHECVVPHREGYHVIMAIWDVSFGQTFYQAIDVMFPASASGPAPTPVTGVPAPTCADLEAEYTACLAGDAPHTPEPAAQTATPSTAGTDVPVWEAPPGVPVLPSEPYPVFPPSCNGERLMMWKSCSGREECCDVSLRCGGGLCRP